MHSYPMTSGSNVGTVFTSQLRSEHEVEKEEDEKV